MKPTTLQRLNELRDSISDFMVECNIEEGNNTQLAYLISLLDDVRHEIYNLGA